MLLVCTYLLNPLINATIRNFILLNNGLQKLLLIAYVYMYLSYNLRDPASNGNLQSKASAQNDGLKISRFALTYLVAA